MPHFPLCPTPYIYHQNLQKKKFVSKNILLAPLGSKSKKVAIFTKKPENHEKSIFFVKNGHIDPKIWESEVPHYIKLYYFLKFWNFLFFIYFLPIMAAILAKNGIFRHFWAKNTKFRKIDSKIRKTLSKKSF